VSRQAELVERLAERVSLWNRAHKLRLFFETIQPDAETTVVDVGVGDTGFSTGRGAARTHNYFEAMYPWPERITAVSDVALSNFGAEFPSVRCVTADGRDLPFPDNAFDVAVSNAVLEHVGERDDQRAFVRELCRVAPRVFVSTPNRWFPIEVHTLMPLVHWLPRRPRDRAFQALRRESWRGVELLGPRALLQLFPDGVDTRIVEQRLTISAVAVRSGWTPT
jgi:2-polyprenyl-3-methyl-5-hydroxy-6-metoxy-1,4-benzoquinol methylase